MMTPGCALSTPALHVPAVLTTLPRLLSSSVSSPKYQTFPIRVLGEIVKRIFLQDAMHKNSVVDNPTGYSIDDHRSVCNREHISELTAFLNALVNKSSPWLQREEWIVDVCRETLGIDVVGCRNCGSDGQMQSQQRERSSKGRYCVLSFHNLIFCFGFLS